MNYNLPPNAEQGQDEANLLLAEAARDAIHLQCEQIIMTSFSRIRSKLADDAEQIGMYEASDMPEGKTVPIYVSPDMRDAPMDEDGPQETLTILLGYNSIHTGLPAEESGSQLRI